MGNEIMVKIGIDPPQPDPRPIFERLEEKLTWRDMIGQKVRRRYLEGHGFHRNLPGLDQFIVCDELDMLTEVWAVSYEQSAREAKPDEPVDRCTTLGIKVHNSGGEFVRVVEFCVVYWRFLKNRWVGLPSISEKDDEIWFGEDAAKVMEEGQEDDPFGQLRCRLDEEDRRRAFDLTV